MDYSEYMVVIVLTLSILSLQCTINIAIRDFMGDDYI